jgi:two-component system cell cycle sensor histidine kinase/response regulator CckA
MMHRCAARHAGGGPLLAPLAVLLAPAASRAAAGGSLPPGGTGNEWLVLVAILALGVLAVGLAGLVLALRRRPLHSLRQWLDRLDLPAAAASTSGRVLHANPAMRAAVGGAGRDLARMLAAACQADPARIYRLAVAARQIGFSFEQVRAVPSGDPVFLAARSAGPGVVVWTLTPPERMPGAVREAGSGVFARASFAHLEAGPEGVLANPVFRQRFAEPPARLAELAMADAAPAGRRMLLALRAGGTELCNVWTFPRQAAAAAVRDVFVLPVISGGEGPTALPTLEAVPVALMQLDLAGRLLWCNAQAREMVGRQARPGVALSELVETLGRPLDALLGDATARPGSRREMVRLRDSDADTFLHIALTRATLDGTPSLLAVLSDASELRLLEDKFAQSQKMEAVGKLAGGVAHDFNNVLTAISGHSDLLLLGKDALHPDYSDLMQIRQNTHRAAALVRQLLAFSRKQTLKPELLALEDVVSDTQYLLNRLIGEKITLTVEHGPDLWPVRADQQQLEQALMNLVVNARDAMPAGGTVTLATRNVTLDDHRTLERVEIPAGDYVEISVTDSGTGIEPHLLGRIFEPFFTTKARGEGTGLGLSTVYGIVKQSGGFIFAENRAEGGARFRILLPRARAQKGREEVQAAPPRADRRDLTGKGVVLLVEDEDPVRAFASRALKLRGYEVVEAASAEEAMDFLSDAANQVDVLVSDVVMPGLDGPSFAVEARRLRPGLRVVFVSGYAEDSFRRTEMHGDFLFLPKPFSLTELTAKVKEALGQAA